MDLNFDSQAYGLVFPNRPTIPPPVPPHNGRAVRRTFKRIPDLYFPDGNIILQAGTTHFRVSSSILAARSSVLENMISLPPSDQDGSKVDGCKVIQLVRDDTEEVACFLRAIFDSSFFEPPPIQTTIVIVIAILRLSTKYEVRYLQQRALNHLDILYPLTLTAFDMRQKSRTMPWRRNTAFYVACLAYQLGMEWLLPSALYCVCACPLEDLVQGFVWEEGEGGERMQMDMENKVRCLRALSELGNREKRDILGFLTVNEVEGCATPDECRKGRIEMLRRLNAGRRRNMDPLAAMHPEQERWRQYRASVCKVCGKEGKRAYREARQKLWNAIPGIFGLQDWEVLQRSSSRLEA